MSVKNIREQKAAKTAEARAMLSKAEGESRSLSADESTTFDKLRGEIESLESQEARQQFLEDAERRTSGTVIAGNGERSIADLERRVSVLRIVQAGMEGRALDGAEAEYNREMERRNGRKAEGVYMPMSALEARVNLTSTASELVGTDHRADQYIEGLRDNLVARRLGVRVLSGLRGNVSIPKHGTSVTSGWVAENSALTASDMTFDNVSLAPKHVGALSEMSRQLIQQSDPSIERLLRDDLSYQIAKAIDTALIVGGGLNEPDGITTTLAAANGTLAGPTWAQVLEIIKDVEAANALGAHGWLMGPTAKAKLRGALKVTGDAGAGFLLENGQMGGYNVTTSNAVPGGAGTSGVIFGDWSQAILGIWSELDLLVNPYESTAYARGGVMIRAMATVDAAIRHAESFVWADDVPA